MPPQKRRHVPEPQNRKLFDVWNSASTGHQRGDNAYAGSSAWQRTRSEKLGRQFRYGDCSVAESGAAVSDADPESANGNDNGNGNGIWDGRYGDGHLTGGDGGGGGEWAWVSEAEGRRQDIGSRDIRSYMGITKQRASTSGSDYAQKERKKLRPTIESTDNPDTAQPQQNLHPQNEPTQQPPAQADRALFHGLHIYINGSTMPLISDHKLKHLLVSHGASIAISLARSTVTHVIVGKPSSSGSGGAGGGLAAGKLQKEIERCGRRIRVVTVEWVLESLKASKRLSEAGFSLNLAPKGQESVLGMFSR